MLAVGLVVLQVLLLVATLAITVIAGHWCLWGAMLWALSFAIFASAFVSLGKSLTPSPIPNQNGLKTGGIYQVIRHPMYLSLLIFGLGSLCFSAWAGIPFVLLTCLLFVKMTLEERLLKEAYPEFDAYSAKTNRIIPYLW